ncbi:MAG: ABC transporter permease [Chloroflexi bacterium]|nr:ABC transporter permease [Chloroflexota bacterium]
MNFLESIRIALRSLAANKMRASLTMLGIIIGVGAVIALMAVGRGAQANIIGSLQSQGTNLLYVSPGSTSSGGVNQGAGSAATLTLEDATALNDPSLAPAVLAVAAEFGSNGQVAYQGQNTRTRVNGVTVSYSAVRNVSIAEGEWFTDEQMAAKTTVVVLGPTTATNLFGENDPVGQTIRINSLPFRVIGVTVAKGGTGFGSQDDVIYAPITTVMSRLASGGQFRGQANISTISVQVVDASQIQNAISQISAILRERHHLTTGDDDFRITSLDDILKTLTQVSDTLTLFLGGIAAISLVVGGIGIMNIMLVSVTERTREIGIRKAVGARKADILLQFLTEAIVLSIVGGLIGIGVGMAVAWALTASGTITAVVDLDSILLATVFSTAIGLFFGIYPANRAGSLNPIDALRYE